MLSRRAIALQGIGFTPAAVATQGLVQPYVVVTGTFAATEARDTLLASGAVNVRGSVNATETGNDTLQASSAIIVRGLFNATETGQDVMSASGVGSYSIAPPLFIANVGRMMGR